LVESFETPQFVAQAGSGGRRYARPPGAKKASDRQRGGGGRKSKGSGRWGWVVVEAEAPRQRWEDGWEKYGGEEARAPW